MFSNVFLHCSLTNSFFKHLHAALHNDDDEDAVSMMEEEQVQVNASSSPYGEQNETLSSGKE